MSYEGYVQLLCGSGHHWSVDCNEYMEMASEKCPICGKQATWINHVDQTNGDIDDEGYNISGHVNLKLKHELRCPTCDSVLEEIYKHPADDSPDPQLPIFTAIDKDDY